MVSWENPWFPVDFPFSQPMDGLGRTWGENWVCHVDLLSPIELLVGENSLGLETTIGWPN